MKSSLWPCQSVFLLGGIAIGAGLMYLLDSDRGLDRRARVRSRALLQLRKLATLAGEKVRDLRKTLQATPLRRVGQISLVTRRPMPDWVLAERARLEIWRAVAHPDSIQISARDGHVTLWGPVLAGEPESLRGRLLKVPGVRQLELQLTTRKESVPRVA